MGFGVFCAVLCAALLHASWNALIKTGQDKQASMLLLTVSQGIFGLSVVIWLPFPKAEVWPWLFWSGVIHMFYQLFLAYAYEQGDLSRVYPIARGTAPLIVLCFSPVLLSDVILPMEYLGVALLGAGIVLMARGAFVNGESRRMLPFALGSATATAGYSIVDGLGARVSGDPVAYVGWLLVLSSVFYVPAVLALRGRSVLSAPPVDWLRAGLAGGASLVAYGIVVWAMTQAPIALVTALRETSILFAVLMGWLVFGDPMDRWKAVAACLIVAGVGVTRL